MSAVIATLAWLCAHLPLRWRPIAGRLLGFFAQRLFRYRVGHVERALASAGIAEDASAIYRSLGMGIVELLAVGANGAAPRVAITEPSRVAFDEALARGPVILFASHTANWELAAGAAAAFLEARGRKLFIVAKEQSVSAVHVFCMRVRRRLGVEVIAPRGAFTRARQALANGDVVVLPIDQVPDKTAHALRVPFLGADALVDRAPATLAFRAKATVLVAAATRTAAGQDVHVLRALAKPEPHERAAAYVDRTTREATAALDTFVRKHPSDWLWLHRRWKQTARFDERERDGAPPRRPSLGFSENPG